MTRYIKEFPKRTKKKKGQVTVVSPFLFKDDIQLCVLPAGPRRVIPASLDLLQRDCGRFIVPAESTLYGLTRLLFSRFRANHSSSADVSFLRPYRGSLPDLTWTLAPSSCDDPPFLRRGDFPQCLTPSVVHGLLTHLLVRLDNIKVLRFPKYKHYR